MPLMQGSWYGFASEKLPMRRCWPALSTSFWCLSDSTYLHFAAASFLMEACPGAIVPRLRFLVLLLPTVQMLALSSSVTLLLPTVQMLALSSSVTLLLPTVQMLALSSSVTLLLPTVQMLALSSSVTLLLLLQSSSSSSSKLPVTQLNFSPRKTASLSTGWKMPHAKWDTSECGSQSLSGNLQMPLPLSVDPPGVLFGVEFHHVAQALVRNEPRHAGCAALVADQLAHILVQRVQDAAPLRARNLTGGVVEGKFLFLPWVETGRGSVEPEKELPVLFVVAEHS
eukprot:CAMPEP_0172086298 /NCGR_PEP_ID=MMETSP1043-20130122/22051_1 /TAXON_ID=464988 /ORGANISM="Hemiselmis andersenii, Strain CCMP441" /LENGTH=282 /DNA_ID=CAMNT_0012748377 /DNA_START=43 /DNA_END=887 /DNA_ORIENTATION=-